MTDKFEKFLALAGWRDATVLPLAGDASFRRYFRVKRDGQTAMLMDAPPPHEDPRPFLHVARYLDQNGLRAPKILAEDAAQGLVLLEDFGDDRMREAVDGPLHDQEERIYRKAIEALIALHAAPKADVPCYDLATYHREADLLVEWYAPARGLDVDVAGYRKAWDAVLTPMIAAEASQVTVLRDYHAENIMLLDDGTQGLLDFQDALIGDPSYDLVSLLQDARRDVSPSLEAQMLDHYIEKMQPDFDLDRHYHVLGAQRNAKIVGIFIRLWKRDGKPRYPKMIPRVWGLLERDLCHPALAPVAEWFDSNIPDALRDPNGVLGGEFDL
jgi:aminoglycoside/choline kinase family phosphotransferase